MINQFKQPAACAQQSSRYDKQLSQVLSCSSKSDGYISGTKSSKYFQQSLRKYDLTLVKGQTLSPMRQICLNKLDNRFFFQSSQRSYQIDITKKIKKVETPFKRQVNNLMNDYQRDAILDDVRTEQAILADNFLRQVQEIIKENVSQEDYSSEVDINPNGQIILADFIKQQNQNLDMQHQHYVIQQFGATNSNQNQNDANFDNIMICQNIESDKISKSISNSAKENNLSSSKDSKSFEQILIGKKHHRRFIRKQKKKVAKSINKKKQNLISFMDSLNKKKTQFDRRQLVNQLSHHLCEKKFNQLKNELKKLI